MRWLVLVGLAAMVTLAGIQVASMAPADVGTAARSAAAESASQPPASPDAVVEAVWQAVARYFFDPGFSQEQWEAIKERYLEEARRPGADPYEIASRMISSLGPESVVLLKAQEASRLAPAPPREDVVGVGVVIYSTDKQEVVVRRVIPGGPASRGGVRRGDRVVAVDGVATAGLSIGEVGAAIRGKEGSRVTLELLDPDGARRTVSLVRRAYTFEPRIESRVLSGNVGYLYLPHFQQGMETAFLGELRKLYRTRALILDLRDSVAGGDLLTLSHIAGLFMTEPLGLLVQRDQVSLVPSRKSDSSDNPLIPAPTELDFYSRPMAVLVDQTTRFHHLAFALRESGRAVLVGRPTTEGGGQFQTSVPLPDGGAAVVTYARFYSFQGKPLVGPVVPDVVVPVDASFLRRWAQGGDLDVERALDALQRQQRA